MAGILLRADGDYAAAIAVALWPAAVLFEELAAPVGGLDWYRANVPVETLPGADAPELPPVAAPTLALFGEKDPYLSERAMHASERFVTGGWRSERLSGAGHWFQLEQPESG